MLSLKLSERLFREMQLLVFMPKEVSLFSESLLEVYSVCILRAVVELQVP